jgi:hypothetical protein
VTTRLPCGTAAAYLRHRRDGTPVCEPCREAKAADGVMRRAAATQARAAVGRARAAALEALMHRHPKEYADLHAAALREEQAS